MRLVIFWSFYPQRADNRQPCQEEVERVIYLFLTQCNTFSHKEAAEYIKNILWVNRMPYILPWDADTGKNKKTYEEMLSITDDPTKIITLQLMDLLHYQTWAELELPPHRKPGRRDFPAILEVGRFWRA